VDLDIPTEVRFAVATALPSISVSQQEQLAGYLALVQQYNDVLGLTSFKGTNQLVFGLVLESLKLGELGALPVGKKAVDLGSGSGSPLVALAITFPQVQFTAVESNQRKAAFLKQVQVRLQLKNVLVATERAESPPASSRNAYQLLTSRAFAPPTKLLPIASRWLMRPGEVRGYTGADSQPLEDAAATFGFEVVCLYTYEAETGLKHVYKLRWG